MFIYLVENLELNMTWYIMLNNKWIKFWTSRNVPIYYHRQICRKKLLFIGRDIKKWGIHMYHFKFYNYVFIILNFNNHIFVQYNLNMYYLYSKFKLIMLKISSITPTCPLPPSHSSSIVAAVLVAPSHTTPCKQPIATTNTLVVRS